MAHRFPAAGVGRRPNRRRATSPSFLLSADPMATGITKVLNCGGSNTARQTLWPCRRRCRRGSSPKCWACPRRPAAHRALSRRRRRHFRSSSRRRWLGFDDRQARDSAAVECGRLEAGRTETTAVRRKRGAGRGYSRSKEALRRNLVGRQERKAREPAPVERDELRMSEPKTGGSTSL
jgi:hypothetical protein